MKNHKSVLLLLCLLISVVFVMSANAADAVTLTLVPSASTVSQGDEVTVSLNISDNPGIMAAVLGIQFDTSRLEFIAGEDSGFTGWSVTANNAAWIGDNDTKFNGEILRLKYKVLADAPEGDAAVTVICEEGDMGDSQENPYVPTIVPASIKVAGQQGPVQPSSIELIPSGTSLMIGDTLSVYLQVKPDGADKTVKWESNNPSVASVDQNGVVTANSVGNATITATSSVNPAVSGKMTISVLGPAPVVKPTSVTLSPASGETTINGTLQVTAEVKPDDAADKSVKWTSSNPSVAVVNPNGVVTGISAGQATITATSNADPSVSGRMTVTVLAPAPVMPLSVTLTPLTAEVAINGTLKVTAVVKPDNATDKTVSWSSSDTSIAIVNSQGIVTGVSEGTVTITATSNADPSVYGQMRVTVTNAPVPPNPPHPTPFNRLDDVVLPRTGFSALRPQVISEKPLNISYKPVSLMLEIPSLSVSADIAEVPFVDGDYPITWLGESVGLLEGFALPGEGYTVLTGHNHLNNTEAGPFALLASLQEGDRIFIRDGHDALKTYVVYANEKVAEADSSAVENIAVKYAGSLTMITCEDERVDGGYANRRIVAARPY